MKAKKPTKGNSKTKIFLNSTTKVTNYLISLVMS